MFYFFEYFSFTQPIKDGVQLLPFVFFIQSIIIGRTVTPYFRNVDQLTSLRHFILFPKKIRTHLAWWAGLSKCGRRIRMTLGITHWFINDFQRFLSSISERTEQLCAL